MEISYEDKIIRSNIPCWLMGQTIHTAEKEKFEGYKGKGLKWGQIDKQKYESIDVLELWPDDRSTTKIPSCVKDLPKLTTLIIPSWFVPHLTEDDLPKSLKALQVGVFDENKPKISWVKERVFRGIAMLDLGRVISDFYASNFPQLQISLVITAGHKKLSFSEIGKCDHLKNLFIHKAETIESINQTGTPSIKFLGLMEGKHDDLHGIKNFENVHEFEIKWNKKLVSLNGIEALHVLEKVEVMDCPKLENIEAVLKLKHLKWIKVLNCGQAWGKDINTLNKQFSNVGFKEFRFEPDGRYSLLEAWRTK